jgi:hypothetical protein
MHETGVRIPGADWRDWLLKVADTRGLRRIEVSGDLLAEHGDELVRRSQHLAISLLHVTDVVPSNLGRYFGESELADDGVVLASLLSRVREGVPAKLRIASLDLGLDRLTGRQVDAGLQRRARLLRGLSRELAAQSTGIALRVRVPRPFVGSHEWEWAANLLHELGEPRCRLAVDVVMPELGAGFDIDALLRDCGARLGVLRLHFRWRDPETPAASQWALWSAALRRHAGPFAVVFCPRRPTLASAAALLADIECWAEGM